MPKALLWTFIVMLLVGGFLFWLSRYTYEPGHEGYWTAFALHGVAEFWGFALGIFVTFVIGVYLADEKIKSFIKLVAQLRKNKVIEGETARGVVICATKLFSEKKLTKGLSTSIRPTEATCEVCVLPFETNRERTCPHCFLEDHYWKIPDESKT